MKKLTVLQQIKCVPNCREKSAKKSKSVTDFLATYHHQCETKYDHADLNNQTVGPGPSTEDNSLQELMMN